MAHPEHEAFVTASLSKHPWAKTGKVLEFGSFDVNGSTRKFFDTPSYTGVDHRAGPGVDVVSRFHDFQSAAAFDVFVCCNTLEHDPYWRQSLERGFSLLRPGGLFILTVPWGYPPHEPGCAPDKPEHYENISSADLFAEMPANAPMDFIRLTEPPETHVCGIKP